MTTYVTRVVLSRADEPTRLSSHAAGSHELFCVSWTLSKPDDVDQEYTQSHHTLSSAHSHATKLLQRMPLGASVADIYREQLDDDLPSDARNLVERCVCGHPSHPSNFCPCGCSISETDNGRDASVNANGPVTSSSSGY